MAKSNNQVHVLIIGSPRSGTTLLSAMLGCHSNIALLSEDYSCSEFKILSKPIKGNKLCIPNQIELEHSKSSRVSDSIVSLYQHNRNKIRRRLKMKTPIPLRRKARLSIRDYERVANNLHIFGIIRSPKSVISSVQKRGQQSRREAEYRWRRAVEVLYELSNNRDAGTDLSIIHYDRLVSSPETIMRRCLSAIQCEYEESVLSGFMHTPQYKDRKEIDTSKVSDGIDSDLDYPLLKKDAELAKKYSALYGASLC